MDIYLILFVTSFLILWFNTESFVEYFSLLRANLFKTNEYLAAKQSDCTLTYHTFLLKKYNCFFTRLITCPICVTAWWCILLFVVFNFYLIELPVIFIFSLVLYYLFLKISP